MTIYESLKDLGFSEYEIESMMRTACLDLELRHELTTQRDNNISASQQYDLALQRMRTRVDVLYGGRTLMTTDFITREATRILENKLNLSREVNNDAAGLAPTLRPRDPEVGSPHP